MARKPAAKKPAAKKAPARAAKSKYKFIIVTKRNRICQIQFNRPEAMNALNVEMAKEITEILVEVETDRTIIAVSLSGNERAFCAGADLKYVKDIMMSGDPEVIRRFMVDTTDMFNRIEAFEKPIIAAINGIAAAGGIELLLCCDLVIAAESATIADAHANYGLLPGGGGTQRLPRLIGINRAKELSLSGNYLDAQTACAWGLVNRVVDPEALLPTCRPLAEDILSTDVQTRREIKRIMDEGWHASLAEGLEIEQQASTEHGRTEVRPEKVAARRAAIQSRGREQSS